MMKRLVLYTIGAFLAALLSVTAFAQPGQQQRNPEKRFQRLDRNQDGKISRDEWPGNPRAFDRLDTSQDGFLTRDELAAARPRHRPGARLLMEMDKNHDNQISRDEWTRRPKAFDRLDLNHDGVITREELQQLRPRRQ
ncbi:MAG: EF-hand domain-containing protein [Blastocatellia bacterium]